MDATASKLADDDDPLSYVLGYTCVNDVTARDLQRKDVQFTRAKSFDTFCPVGPVIVNDLDPLNLDVTTRVNGASSKRATLRDMAFSVPFLVRYIADIMTLYPGRLDCHGNTGGCFPDEGWRFVEVEIEGIGVLRNTGNVRIATSSQLKL